MRNQWLCVLMGGLLIGLLSVSITWAGQVVTERDKNWARQALAQEAALQAAQMPDNTLAVLNFANTTGQTALDPTQKGLAFMLLTDLSSIRALVVLEREKSQALLDEMDLGASGLVELGTEARMGRLLGARFLVSGGISAGPDAPHGLADEGAISQVLETRIQVSPVVLDVPPGQRSNLSTVEGPVGSLFQMEKEILMAVVEHLEIALSDEQKAALRIPATTNGRALYYFFMGLTYSDMGRYKRSGVYYEKALKEDPAFSWPRASLKELTQRGLYMPPRTISPILKSLRKRTSLTDSVSPDEVLKRARTPYDVELRQRLKPKPVAELDLDGDGFTPLQGDCNDSNKAVYPSAEEICGDGIDQDCNGTDLACATIDADGDGYTVEKGDCNDSNAAIYPGAKETQCDDIDQNCDGSDLCQDIDQDGYSVLVDCDDRNPSIYPNAEEIECDQVDQDCDGSDACPTPVDVNDADSDGYTVDEDCDDNNSSIYPDAPEIQCDGVDQDCDGSDLCEDADNDGFNLLVDCNDQDASIHPDATEIECDNIDQDCDSRDTCSQACDDCDDDGYTTQQGDCNDNDATLHPGAEETCGDGIDQDCNGTDLTCDTPVDFDGDGYSVAQNDCDDNNAAINPGVLEAEFTSMHCDQIDQDCDGSDYCPTSGVDLDGDGYTVAQNDCNDNNAEINPGVLEAEFTSMHCDQIDQDCDGSDYCPTSGVDLDGDGYTVQSGDCNDNNAAIYPGAREIQCDDIDQDCDGYDYCDNDQDGYTTQMGDCNDNNSSIYPSAPEEQCDGVDSNCDGSDPCPDNDGDGFNYLQDCNDKDPSIHPGAQEIWCDDIDQDCNGSDLCLIIIPPVFNR